MLTSALIKQISIQYGADEVGIASLDRFEGAPRQMDPRYIFPGAKSLIGLIFRIPRGYLRGLEEGTQFCQYPSLGYAGINEDIAPTVLYRVGRYLEDNGFEACVYRNTGGRGPVSDVTGKEEITVSPEEAHRTVNYARPLSPDRPAPDVFFHFRIAAYICGLGEIGYSKMFLSPRFGPLNRQAFILTDAALESDPIYNGPVLCNKCMACVKACPGHCLNQHKTVDVKIAGRTVSWGEFDEWRCFAYYEGANQASNPFLPSDAFQDLPGGELIIKGMGRVDRQNYPRISKILKSHYPAMPDGYNPPKCSGCLRACFQSMERRGVLKGKFQNPFRCGKALGLDASSNINHDKP